MSNLQICKINQRYLEDENRKIRRVQDVIPESRLAMYGNYEYNEEREKKYKQIETINEIEEYDNFENNQISQPWMYPEVEDHFTRLSEHICHIVFNNQLVSLKKNTKQFKFSRCFISLFSNFNFSIVL